MQQSSISAVFMVRTSLQTTGGRSIQTATVRQGYTFCNGTIGYGQKALPFNTQPTITPNKLMLFMIRSFWMLFFYILGVWHQINAHKISY